MVFAGIDPAFRKPSVIAVIRRKGERLVIDEISPVGKGKKRGETEEEKRKRLEEAKEELRRILENKGLISFTVDCPLYLPGGGKKWRQEEDKLNEMKIKRYSPLNSSMRKLHKWVKELLDLEGKPCEQGFAPGLGGKCRVYEVHPYASFRMLPKARGVRLISKKKGKEAQEQRLKLLGEYVDGLEKYIGQKTDHDALDAVVAALTHYFIMSGKAQKLGKCLWIPEI